jgi:hypothetical protein
VDAVLKNGALPLEILEEQVNDYVQPKKGRESIEPRIARMAQIIEGT